MKRIILLIIFIIAFVSVSEISYAQPTNPRLEKCQPTYGKYCCDSKWGWYGAKRVIKTDMDAREILLRYFSTYKDVRIGTVKERGSFFEAEITDEEGVVIDFVIIDKRTGRIRSIY